MNSIDKAVSTANFILKKRKKLVDSMSRKVEITENQKIYIGEELDLIRNVEILIKQCGKNINLQLGKLPPQATEIEETVLGAIILEGSAQKVAGLLEAKHFYMQAHQDIFEAIKALWNADSPIDMRTVTEKLRRQGKLELAGGAVKIAEITSKASSSANIDYHAHVLIEMAIKRQLILMSGKILAEAYEDTNDCFDILDEAKEQMKEIETWIK